MDLFYIIRIGLLFTAILLLLTFVTLKQELKAQRFSFSYFGTHLIKALLFSQILALISTLALLEWDSDPETIEYNLEIIYSMSGFGFGMALIGHTSIYLAQWIGARMRVSFFYKQILEFFAALLGIGLGGIVSNAVLYFTVPNLHGYGWIPRRDNWTEWNIMFSGIMLVAFLVASTRVFYNSKLFDEQQARAKRELDVLKLQEQATAARLQVLQTRINPHFLHNALNAIASLVHEDADKAEKMTMALYQLFSESLDSEASHCSTVQQEVALVQTYLDIEEIRFGNRLSTSISVDPKALDEKIPRFLLQPLVENAIKHGVANQDGDGFVGIQISKKQDALEIFVKDSGPEFPLQMTGGYGWKSVSGSLDLLYPGRHELYLVNSPEKHVHLSLKNDA